MLRGSIIKEIKLQTCYEVGGDDMGKTSSLGKK